MKRRYNPIRLVIGLSSFFVTAIQGQTSLEPLYKQAKRLSHMDYLESKADSVSEEAIARAEASLNEILVSEAIMAYMTRDEYGNMDRIPIKYVDRGMQVADQLKDPLKRFQFWINLSKQYLANGEYRKGSEIANLALSYAASSSDNKIKTKAYLISAIAARYNQQVKQAWQNLLNAQNHIAKLKQSEQVELQNQYYQELTQFHLSINNNKKALETKQQQMKHILEQTPVDSIKYMWSLFDLSSMLASGENDIRIDHHIKKLLNFTDRNGVKSLNHYVNALNRNYLINNFQLKDFYNQFSSEYSDKNYNINSSEYCLGNALFCEYKQHIDSAKIFYQAALKSAEQSNNDYRLANYYRLYGEFLMRNGLESEAYEAFQRSLALAQKKNYSPYIVAVLDPLDSLAQNFNDYKSAYTYADLKNKTSAAIADEQIKENLLLMELENDRVQNEYLVQAAEEKAAKKHNLQYLTIAVGLITLFLLFVLLSSMTVPAWLIEMFGFFSILFIFEFVILILDHKIHHWAHGEPIKIFLVKIIILSVLFPLHHVIEHGVITYMKKNKLIKRPKQGFLRKSLAKLYPWLNEGEHATHD